MKNPYPEHGEIQEINLNTFVSYSELCSGRVPVYPDIYELHIHYDTCRFKWSAFNVTKEQYKEICQNIFENAEFEFTQEGWPVSLVWDKCVFKPESIEQVLYKK